MSNPSKAKGTAAETAVTEYLKGRGITATRAPQHGSADRGDVWAFPTDAGHRLVIEVKAGEQAANPTMTQVRAWQREANVEAARVPDADAAVLVLKRKGSAKPADWDAYVRNGDVESWGNPRLTSTRWAWQWVCLPLGELIDHLVVES
jgi:Holliday junction resolvase